jgi:hypothetical protein
MYYTGVQNARNKNAKQSISRCCGFDPGYEQKYKRKVITNGAK